MKKCEAPREPWHWFADQSEECSTAGGDIRFDGGDLARGSELESAVVMQLLTDRGDDVGQGWWGAYDMPFEPGSRLWKLRQRPRIDKDTLIDAERYVREAIDQLIAQGLAARYEVDVSGSNGSISIDVSMFDDSGRRIYSQNIPWVY